LKRKDRCQEAGQMGGLSSTTAVSRSTDFFLLVIPSRGAFGPPKGMKTPRPWATFFSLQLPFPFCHSERSEESAVRLYPSPIPEGDPTANYDCFSTGQFCLWRTRPTCPDPPWSNPEAPNDYFPAASCFNRFRSCTRSALEK
jgi:hypothetical protein